MNLQCVLYRMLTFQLVFENVEDIRRFLSRSIKNWEFSLNKSETLVDDSTESVPSWRSKRYYIQSCKSCSKCILFFLTLSYWFTLQFNFVWVSHEEVHNSICQSRISDIIILFGDRQLRCHNHGFTIVSFFQDAYSRAYPSFSCSLLGHKTRP